MGFAVGNNLIQCSSWNPHHQARSTGNTSDLSVHSQQDTAKRFRSFLAIYGFVGAVLSGPWLC